MSKYRLIVLNRVERGMMTAREAAKILDVSPRQVKRIIAAYRKEGASALAHGNRGRKPRHTPDAWMKKKILELFQTVYRACNHQHFSLLLVEREELDLSRSLVCRILLEAGIRRLRKRRAPKHHSAAESVTPEKEWRVRHHLRI